VIKLGMPAHEPFVRELRALDVANGRGYARLLRRDEERGAVLLERRGAPLREAGLSVEAQIEILCATMRRAWVAVPPGAGLEPGARAAVSHLDSVEAAWEELSHPCSERVIESVRACARSRAAGTSWSIRTAISRSRPGIWPFP
jgi:streptomycin 6-kinase